MRYLMFATSSGDTWANRELVWESDVNPVEAGVYDVSVSEEVNKASELEFTVAQSHPYYSRFRRHKTVLTVVDDTGFTLFRGSVKQISKDIFKQKKISAVGALEYLAHSILLPRSAGYNGTPSDAYYDAITRHNEQMAGDTEKIFIADVHNDRPGITNQKHFDANSYQDTMSFINSELIDQYGGYLKITYNADYTEQTLDYVKEYDSGINPKTVTFGRNIVDIQSDDEAEDLFTVLIPSGDNQLTIDGKIAHLPTTPTVETRTATVTKPDGSTQTISVQLNGPYMMIPSGIEAYGRIVHAESFSGVTDKEELITKALEYISNHYKPDLMSFTVTAVDLHILDPENHPEPIRLGDMVNVVSEFGGEPVKLMCSQIQHNLTDPDETEYTIGVPNQTFTEKHNKESRSGGSAASQAAGQASRDRTIEYDNLTVNIKEQLRIVVGEVLKTMVADDVASTLLTMYPNYFELLATDLLTNHTARIGGGVYKSEPIWQVDEHGDPVLDPDGNPIQDYDVIPDVPKWQKDSEGNYVLDENGRMIPVYKTDESGNVVYTTSYRYIVKQGLTPNQNPMAMGLYEKDSYGRYFRTTDQSPQSGTTYYEAIPVQAKDESGELVWEKNPDGSYRLDQNGNKIPVYGKDPVQDTESVNVLKWKTDADGNPIVSSYADIVADQVNIAGRAITLTATAMGLELDENGMPKHDEHGNFVFSDNPSEGSLRSDLELKPDSATLITEINKPHYLPVADPTGENPKASGWYEKTSDGYAKTEDVMPVSGKTYYTLDTTTIASGKVQTKPGEVIIEAINRNDPESTNIKIRAAQIELDGTAVMNSITSNDGAVHIADLAVSGGITGQLSGEPTDIVINGGQIQADLITGENLKGYFPGGLYVYPGEIEVEPPIVAEAEVVEVAGTNNYKFRVRYLGSDTWSETTFSRAAGPTSVSLVGEWAGGIYTPRLSPDSSQSIAVSGGTTQIYTPTSPETVTTTGSGSGRTVTLSGPIYYNPDSQEMLSTGYTVSWSTSFSVGNYAGRAVPLGGTTLITVTVTNLVGYIPITVAGETYYIDIRQPI